MLNRDFFPFLQNTENSELDTIYVWEKMYENHATSVKLDSCDNKNNSNNTKINTNINNYSNNSNTINKNKIVLIV